MKNIVLTIGREYGSGGRFIGMEVAKRLNIKFYDKELINMAHKKNGLSFSKLNEYDEAKKNSVIKALNFLSVSNYDLSVFDEDEVQLLISEAIIEAAKEPCIILGRNANNILKDNPNVFNIFIYSKDQKFKIKRKMELENLSYNEAALKLQKTDKSRKRYYESINKNRIWGSKEEYDFIIDSGKFGVEKTIDLIVELYKSQANSNFDI